MELAEIIENAGGGGAGNSCRAAEVAVAETAAAARRCRLCADRLPLGPRPAFQLHAAARVVIIGQAPGTKVHASGRPFTDPSGDRLRDWLGVDKATFYDSKRFAILPAGLCYPGRHARGGDLPPIPECGPLWHGRVLPLLRDLRLVVLIGQYAHALHLKDRRSGTLTATVAAWRDFGPGVFPTPHPSWRVNGWLKRNPWFEEEALPALRQRVSAALAV